MLIINILCNKAFTPCQMVLYIFATAQIKSMRYILFLSIPFMVLAASAHPTCDTAKIMSYNVLNYGFPATESCPALITSNKHAWLRTILQYSKPDILGLEKMDATPASFTSDTIIDKVLDSVCNRCYGHTPYTNVSGYSKENMLYYNTEKFGWISTTTIYSADSNISDINLHTLYYKSPELSISHDTVFLSVILVHLESGSGSAAERTMEMQGAMQWLNTHITHPGNYIFMGDFNTQSSSESCYQQMINSGNANTRFFDVDNQPGNWDADPSNFAHVLTQSTRTSDPGDCGATGGLDDWFDHFLCTDSIMTGYGSVTYVPNSFSVTGQDGQHVNKSLIAAPANTSVPNSVLNALYYMSEHLPITMQLAIDTGSTTTAAVPVVTGSNMQWQYSNPVSGYLSLNALTPDNQHIFSLVIYDLSGRQLINTPLRGTGKNEIPVNKLSNGIYILMVQQNGELITSGKFVKVAPW